MGRPVLTAQEWMKDRIRQDRANAIGKTPPYHLQYARTYENNPVLNPHLKGDKNGTECQDQTDNGRIYGTAKNRQSKRRILTRAAGPMLSGCHSSRDQGSANKHEEDSGA